MSVINDVTVKTIDEEAIIKKLKGDKEVLNYIRALKESVTGWKGINDKALNKIRELTAEKSELIGSLSIALDDKKRKLYKSELIETLNKFKEK